MNFIKYFLNCCNSCNVIFHENRNIFSKEQYEKIPDEIFIEIFKYLENRDLLDLSCSCERFYNIINSGNGHNELYRNLLLNIFKTSNSYLNKTRNFKKRFIDLNTDIIVKNNKDIKILKRKKNFQKRWVLIYIPSYRYSEFEEKISCVDKNVNKMALFDFSPYIRNYASFYEKSKILKKVKVLFLKCITINKFEKKAENLEKLYLSFDKDKAITFSNYQLYEYTFILRVLEFAKYKIKRIYVEGLNMSFDQIIEFNKLESCVESKDALKMELKYFGCPIIFVNSYKDFKNSEDPDLRKIANYTP